MAGKPIWSIPAASSAMAVSRFQRSPTLSTAPAPLATREGLDELARGLAENDISRRQAIKWAGYSVLGATLSSMGFADTVEALEHDILLSGQSLLQRTMDILHPGLVTRKL